MTARIGLDDVEAETDDGGDGYEGDSLRSDDDTDDIEGDSLRSDDDTDDIEGDLGGGGSWTASAGGAHSDADVRDGSRRGNAVTRVRREAP